jgi:NodT family efflux transporter outer membrane factor (OMF) lipoprotein
MMGLRNSLVMATCALAGAGCAPLAPVYTRPDAVLPAQWKTLPGTDAAATDGAAQWKPAEPADAWPKSDWWTVLADAQLDALEARSLAGNFNLQAAVARLDLARAQSNARAAALEPTVQASAGASRSRISANRPLANYGVPNLSTVQNDFRAAVSVSYEFDWLGKIRLDVESAQAGAEQAEADKENVRLLLTAQVAMAYLQLRQLDEEIAVVTSSVELQSKVLDLITRRYRGGASSQADLVQQSALTQASQAQLELLKVQRNQQEDALSTLTGTPAAAFRIAPGKLPAGLPVVPLVMPSALLERRPDIAAAERAVAAANAQIGVARAAYYPSLTLAPALMGYESNAVSSLLSAPSLIWAVGLAASQTLFDAGRTDATVAAARASHAVTVANYRQTVLVAIQEAQDAMDSLLELRVAGQRQDEAVMNQKKAFKIGLTRYREGLDNSVTLATTEQNQLAALRVQTQIRGSQYVAAVSLIKALGGAWPGLESRR